MRDNNMNYGEVRRDIKTPNILRANEEHTISIAHVSKRDKRTPNQVNYLSLTNHHMLCGFFENISLRH